MPENDVDPGDGAYRTRTQQEWADWAAHAYRKAFQPRSVRRFDFLFTIVLAAFLVAGFWFSAHGGLPW